MITFIIPVCHPANSNNWAELKLFLSETIHSISAQDCDEWQAVIIANKGSDLPTLPSKFNVCFVEYSPNEKYDRKLYDVDTIHDAVRLDKGRRMLTGAIAYKESTDYFMYVDCDDFVHKGIANFVKKYSGENGWYVKSGYIWNDSGNYFLKYQDFSRKCGTSLIIRKDLLNIPDSVEEASDEYMQSMFGSHHLVQDILRAQQTPLKPLPFAGAVYRVAHAQAHSLSNSLFRQYLFNYRYLIRPHKFIINLFNLKKINPRLRKAYFGTTKQV